MKPCAVPFPPPKIAPSSRSWIPPWPMRPSAAALGWSAVPGARGAALEFSPSTSSTPSACGRASPISKKHRRKKPFGFSPAQTTRSLASRPMTCRVFGPPIRSADGLGEDGLGVCELCYHGASDEEIAACEIKPDPDDLESTLLQQVEDKTGIRGETIIAFCLAR